MKKALAALLFLTCALCFAAGKGDWPYWRGPAADGMAVGDAPLHWSDTQNVQWKTEIPGRGSSSPVIWGDRIFVTTAVKTGPSTGPEPAAAPKAIARGETSIVNARAPGGAQVSNFSASIERRERSCGSRRQLPQSLMKGIILPTGVSPPIRR